MGDHSLPTPASDLQGSHDGAGAGDHDQPFAGFRRQHFGTRDFSRLLILRGLVLEAKLGHGRFADDVVAG